MNKRHRTSAVYQAALAELRDLHVSEFDDIYMRLLKANGIETLDQVYERKLETVFDFIKESNESGLRPKGADISRALKIPQSTLTGYLKQLQRREKLQLPGQGYPGYEVRLTLEKEMTK